MNYNQRNEAAKDAALLGRIIAALSELAQMVDSGADIGDVPPRVAKHLRSMIRDNVERYSHWAPIVAQAMCAQPAFQAAFVAASGSTIAHKLSLIGDTVIFESVAAGCLRIASIKAPPPEPTEAPEPEADA